MPSCRLDYRLPSPHVDHLRLQGGPGASSTGYGNFEEIGPLDINLKPRAHNWVLTANILFVDQPVGTGYVRLSIPPLLCSVLNAVSPPQSYVTDDSAYATTEQQIASDLVALMKAVSNKYTQFQTSPFYVACESYGGKMTASFAYALLNAIANNQIKMNFKGIALGDSWIRPMSFVNTWAPYLYNTAEIDSNGYQKIMKYANLTQAAVDKQQWAQATSLWGQTENVVEDVTQGINFYNILQRGGSDARAAAARQRMHASESIVAMARRHLQPYHADLLSTLMNGPIRQKLQVRDMLVI